MISRSLSTSEKFAALGTHAGMLGEFCQSLYPLLIPHADDFGRLQGDPFTVKYVCHPSSSRTIQEFSTALGSLHAVGLICWYTVGGKRYIQIQQFEPHQQGLHKRTHSIFPEIPGNRRTFPEFPSEEKKKGREEKGTEQKKKNGHDPLAPVVVTARSKRPIFQGQRFTVFDWMLDDLAKLLGNYTESFDLHQWFFDLDERARREDLVIPQRDHGAWLQAETLQEAQRRGLAIAVATGPSATGKLTQRMAALVAESRGKGS